MSLAESLAAQRKRRAYDERPCAVGNALETLPEADRKVLAAALDDNHLQHSSIALALCDIGVHVRADTVSRHRRRICCRARNV